MESESYKNVKKSLEKTLEFFKTKKGVTILFILILFSIIAFGINIRVQNLDQLEDHTSGEKIPLALDPYYFLRVAETKLENDGNLPECDELRIIPEEKCRGWHPEILPESSILIYKIGSVFNNDFTLRYAHVLNPIVFFAFTIFVYFLLVSKITKSRISALISSVFLSFTPLFLYRTMAGFSDHESIGTFAFILLLLGFVYSLKYLNNNFDKIDKKTSRNKMLFGLLTGALIALSIASWGGIANFAFMIIPLSVLIFWFVKRKSYEDISEEANKNSLDSVKKLSFIPLYYIITILSLIIITPLISGNTISVVIEKFMMSASNIVSIVVLGFLIIDFLTIFVIKKYSLKVKESHSILFTIGVLAAGGILFLLVTGEISLIGDIFEKVLNPMGSGRVGETVAENKAPDLSDLIDKTGKGFFFVFLLGIIFLGGKISKNISKIKKEKIIFFGLFVLMVFGIIFSSHSSLNNSEFLKRFVYFAPAFIFIIYSIYLYTKEKQGSFKIAHEWIIAFSWMLFMIIAVRGAIRLFFVIIPLICFLSGFVPVEIYNFARKSKDDLIKTFAWIVFFIVIILLLTTLNGYYASSVQQAEQTGPSANEKWQSAMSWVRENTEDNSLFLHWWDYGYWVETLGESATLSDGGHFQGQKRTHMIGRHVLTTPNPDSALSFMKSNNATHLLIDSSDIGKYSAYSRIGSGKEMKDRLSQIPTLQKDPEQTQEKRNKTTYVYRGGNYLDEDLVYKQENGKEILLPEQKAALGAILIEEKNDMEGNVTEKPERKFEQPKGIFFYNNQQYEIPIRYLYYQGEIIDFSSEDKENNNTENTVDSIVRIVPSVDQSQGGVNVDENAAAIYLSRKVSKSLIAQIFIMDDPFDRYESLELAHSQEDRIVEMLKAQNAIPQEEDLVVYGGIRGPIKIWETKDIPEDIKINEEFTKKDPYGDDWEFGMLDELEFRK